MKFDLHIHSQFSDGINTPEDIVNRAKKIGLDGIAITDHDSFRALKAAQKAADEVGLIIIPGVEITTVAGDILVYGLEELKDMKNMRNMHAAKIIDKIHELGGIAVAAHPYGGYWTISFVDVMDVLKGKFDAIETFNGNVSFQNNIKAMELAKKIGLPGIAGSDAHHLGSIGSAYTIVEDKDVVKAIKDRKVKVGWEVE